MLLLVTAAHALSCDEALHLLALKVPTPTVVEMVSSHPGLAGDVGACLEEHHAPPEVVRAARAASQVPDTNRMSFAPRLPDSPAPAPLHGPDAWPLDVVPKPQDQPSVPPTANPVDLRVPADPTIAPPPADDD